MTSIRQIESNRRNALKSTGPKTVTGKQRSSKNALRHGLTTETIIKLFEDVDDYQAFELAVTSDYDATTAIERELVLRLASLLWRLRRATSIETGLMQIQGANLQERRWVRTKSPLPGNALLAESFINVATNPCGNAYGTKPNHEDTHPQLNDESTPDLQRDIALSFLRLVNLNGGAFERLGRYETALWRQVRQTIVSLEDLRCRHSNGRRSKAQCPW